MPPKSGKHIRWSCTHNQAALYASIANECPWRVVNGIAHVNAAFVPKDIVRLFVGQVERGEEGNMHFQSAVQFARPVSRQELKAMKDLFGEGSEQGHYEPSFKNWQANRNYCTKDDTRLHRDEEPLLIERDPIPADTPRPAKRSRTKDVAESIRRSQLLGSFIDGHSSMHEMYDAVSQSLSAVMEEMERAPEGSDERTEIEALAAAIQSVHTRILNNGFSVKTLVEEKAAKAQKESYGNSVRTIQVHVVFGKPGVGKSSLPHTRYGGYQKYFHRGGPFFCTYGGEEMLVLDEFGVSLDKEVTPEDILMWLDGNPCKIRRKHKGDGWAGWFHVLILSNYHPDEWFLTDPVVKKSPAFKQALMSRIGGNIEEIVGPDRRLLPENAALPLAVKWKDQVKLSAPVIQSSSAEALQKYRQARLASRPVVQERTTRVREPDIVENTTENRDFVEELEIEGLDDMQ